MTDIDDMLQEIERLEKEKKDLFNLNVTIQGDLHNLSIDMCQISAENEYLKVVNETCAKIIRMQGAKKEDYKMNLIALANYLKSKANEFDYSSTVKSSYHPTRRC